MTTDAPVVARQPSVVRWGATGLIRTLSVLILSLIVSSCDATSSSERMNRARQFLDHGRPNGAIVELKKVLQENPQDGAARRLLGTAYLRLERLSDAEKELAQALELGEEPVAVTLDLGRVWLRQGDFRRVLGNLQVEPDWPAAAQAEALILRAAAHLALGESEDARRSYTSALSIAPDHAEAAVGLVRVAVQGGDTTDIRATLDQALRVAPNHPYLLGLTAGFAFENGDYAAAATAYRAQLAVAPDSIAARLGLAQSLLAKGEDTAAGAELDEILSRVPAHPTALYLRAIVNHRRGDFAAARADSLVALDALPNHEPSMAIAASANYELGRWREARWYADTILRHNPRHDTARQLSEAAGRALSAADGASAPQAARQPIDEDLALFGIRRETAEVGAGTSETPDAERDGLAALFEGREAEAIGPLERALTQQPGEQAVLRLALAHYRAGAEVRARVVMEQWLDHHPGDASVRRALATLHIRNFSWDRALPHLRILAEAEPRDAGTLNNLAWIMLGQGESAEALVLAERAIALAPDDPRVMDTFALALLQTGAVDRAVDLLRRAAASDVGPPEIRLHFAQALLRHGNRDEARSVLKDIVASGETVEARRSAEVLLLTLEE